MPTALRVGPYRFFFYSDEAGEPAHVHVSRDRQTAKFWLRPVELARSSGYTMVEINEVWRLVTANRELLEAKWDEFHGTRDE